jgi:hypothetical protein
LKTSSEGLLDHLVGVAVRPSLVTDCPDDVTA